ncbi:F-box/kelch-repeat protein At3g06240-like [Solanum dulcamara]|uniref:F-box/kelch-repeat protein At3g06240-like n=1 Tax=Solanum dulcamara TaxID=45834 RepID=UPI0024861F66|nr:F-box/kelch-repeat protein At3g06240-like [Solanum dulcamara]XP_055828364.1 F-box/kelch-repeat protein At3g06240-like [Solanum dulcamara]
MEIHYQEGMIMDILIRLPVRSLLRFKCVSKLWKTLISESYFKMKHLSHANNDLNSQKLLVREQFSSGIYNFFSYSLSTNQLVRDAQNRPSNCSPFADAYIYSSCDGLVLLGLVHSFRNQLLLWNHSTRESMELILPHSGFRLEDTTFGFGYDANSNDYKIVKVNKGGVLLPSIEILTLKSRSWRSICNFPTIVCPKTGSQMEIHPYLYNGCVMSPVVFVHGAFHWLGRSHNYSVVSFSTSNEVYRDIPLLERMYRFDHKQSTNYGISVFGGMLCFYSTHNYHRDQPVTFQLWGMKDYGVVESWTELFTLRASDICYAEPRYRYADGEVLLQCNLDERRGGDGGDVFRTSKGQIGLSYPQPSYLEGIVYTESLISPKSLI